MCGQCWLGSAAERLLDNNGGCVPCLLQALDKLQAEWEGAELGILAYRESGTFIVKACAAHLREAGAVWCGLLALLRTLVLMC